jgi:hypothetical protein
MFLCFSVSLFFTSIFIFWRVYTVAESSQYLCHVRLSVGPSFRLAACISALLLDGFPWNLLLGVLWKCVMKIHIWLKSSKNMGHFAWRPKYVLLSPASLNHVTRSVGMEWYQAVRIAEELQTLREHAIILHWTKLPILFRVCSFIFFAHLLVFSFFHFCCFFPTATIFSFCEWISFFVLIVDFIFVSLLILYIVLYCRLAHYLPLVYLFSLFFYPSVHSMPSICLCNLNLTHYIPNMRHTD